MSTIQSATEKKIVLIADPEILAIPIQENHEPLINLKDQDIISFGPPAEVTDNTDYTKMRVSVYSKLVAAQKLLPDGIKFRLYEGLRSLSLQEKIFTERYNKLKVAHPEWTHEQLFIENTRLVSCVTNLDGTKNTPPHSTGAAIDVYLIDEQEQVLDMGIRTEDWMLDLDGSISVTDSTKISAEAIANRKIMNAVLLEMDFVNYPTEYWHWSYGDRYWAYHKNMPFAIYGSI